MWIIAFGTDRENESGSLKMEIMWDLPNLCPEWNRRKQICPGFSSYSPSNSPPASFAPGLFEAAFGPKSSLTQSECLPFSLLPKVKPNNCCIIVLSSQHAHFTPSFWAHWLLLRFLGYIYSECNSSAFEWTIWLDSVFYWCQRNENQMVTYIMANYRAKPQEEYKTIMVFCCYIPATFIWGCSGVVLYL